MENTTMLMVYPPMDEHGKPVKRTKATHPWSYDGFIIFRALPNSEINSTLYTDRLKGHYPEKWDELCNKHFGEAGDYFDHRDPEAIEAFLCDLLDKPIQIVFIMEYCNHATGYPVWRIDIKYLEEEKLQ